MDALAVVQQLAICVQEIMLPTQEYLADNDREPLHLTAHITNIRELMHDLADNVFGAVPDAVFSQHWRSAQQLEETLIALERGYLRDAHLAPEQDRIREIRMSEGVLREQVEMQMTDKDIAKIHDCSTKTVYRERRKIGLFKYLRQHTTPDH
ncbi:hypothetical protein NCC49_001338, partial [Naganishia albida]